MTADIPPPDPRLSGKVQIKQMQEPQSQQRIFSAAELQTMTFPPLKFILPDLVPEGATLLVSRPKLGKSWLVLDVAIATAAGRFTLGTLKPAAGDVLYLAFEDGRRRLQRRITKVLPTFSITWSQNLEIATEWPRADQGGLADIEGWLKAHPNARLVIIDTLAQFRKLSTGKGQLYPEDYAAISGLQKLASTYNVGIIIVHHDRKSEADDVFDTVSGSLGLTGAADTILIMKRQAGAVTLYVRGRDIEESEMAMQFDKSSCRWSILGTAAEVHRSAERKRVLAVLKEAGSPLQVKDIQSRAELRNPNAAYMLLGKMARDGEIVRADKGRYALSETGAGQMPDRCRTDSRRDGRTDAGQIGQMDRSARQPVVLKEKKGDNPDLSAICPAETDPLAGQIDVPDLSDLSDLSGDRRGTPKTQLVMGASLASAMPVPPGKSNGRGLALGPPGDSLDDFQ